MKNKPKTRNEIEKIRAKIRIVFKSGFAQDLVAEEFRVEYSTENQRVTKMTWTNAVPNILHIDLADVSAVFQLPNDG